jgi:hypothetical protein
MSSNLSPHQILCAQKAVGRLLHLRDLYETAGVTAGPEETVAIPFAEMECLCRAAAAELNMTPNDFDLGGWVAPAATVYVNGEVEV